MWRIILPSAVLLCLLAGCLNHDTVDGKVDMTLTDIATYEGPVGQDSMRFSLRQIDDSPLVILTCLGRFKDNIPTGQRMVINYIPDNGLPYCSGSIYLVSASKITSGTDTLGHITSYPHWDRDKVYVYSVWRTGNYINLHSRVNYTTKPRILRLLVDSATLANPLVDMYLVHQLDTMGEFHDRRYYMSWDISRTWQRAGVKGINLHVANSNLPQTEFKFLK